ncbi:MAG: ethanolamine utilization protein EutH [Clostridia bacterium]|nr:ethanolamine utilization protein EutH [Clostridia bacterium]
MLIFSVLGAIDRILGNRFGMGKEFEKAFMLLGAFPLMFILSKVLAKPLKVIGERIGVNENSIVGLVSNLASSTTVFGMMEKMDKKGVLLNSAFSVSGAFVLGGHLAFTMAFDKAYVVPVIAGKLVAGVLAILLANIIFNKTQSESPEGN